MGERTVDAAAVLVIGFVTLAAASLAQTVIEPLAFAIFFIALISPAQTALQSLLPRPAALLISVGAALAVLIALSSLIVWSGGEIVDWLARNLERVKIVFADATRWLEAHDIFVAALVTEHVNAAFLLGAIQVAAARINIIVGFALVVLLYVAMGLAEASGFREKIAAARGEETARRILRAGARTAEKLRRFMVVRGLASVATGLLVFLFALAIGLDLAPAWGVLTFALNFLPYIGPAVATAAPALFAFAQFNSGEMALLTLGALAFLQFVIGNVLEPAVSGSALSLSPTIVVFSVLLWTFLWGLPGSFIGVPIAIAFFTVCAQFPASRWIARLAGDKAPEEAR